MVERLRKIDAGLAASGFWQIAQQAAGLGDDSIRPHAAFLQQRLDDALLFIGERNQEVQRKHHLALAGFGNCLGLYKASCAFCVNLSNRNMIFVPEFVPEYKTGRRLPRVDRLP